VVVRLGPESHDNALAVDTLKAISDDADFNVDKYTITARSGTPTDLLENDHRALMAKETNWIAVKNLFEREWFSRLWIVQEIKCATEAVICIRPRSLPQHTFRTAVHWVWSRASPSISVFEEVTLHSLEFHN